MRTLYEWMEYLGWSQQDLAREAGINPATAGKAVNGESVSPRVAREIAAAISRASGTSVHPGDLKGLVISR